MRSNSFWSNDRHSYRAASEGQPLPARYGWFHYSPRCYVAPDKWHRATSPQNRSSPKAVQYDPAYRLPLNDKTSHPLLNIKCLFPRVLAKIVRFVNKTKKLIVFSFIVKKTTRTSMQAPEYVQPSTPVQLPTCWSCWTSRPLLSHVHLLKTVHNHPSTCWEPKLGIYPKSLRNPV